MRSSHWLTNTQTRCCRSSWTSRTSTHAPPLAMAKADYAARIALWEEWNAVAIEAQGSKKA